MFRIFPFRFSGIIDINQLGEIVESFLDNMDFSSLVEEFKDEKEETKENIADFINLEEYDDMYVLTIELKGVNLRQTSIQYNPGIISINLNRIEKATDGLGMFTSNSMVKKNYIKEFDNIEAIEESKIIKILENGVLKISMPKKYILYKNLEVVDVDNYVDIDMYSKN